MLADSGTRSLAQGFGELTGKKKIHCTKTPMPFNYTSIKTA
jgi:hypothetical protein